MTTVAFRVNDYTTRTFIQQLFGRNRKLDVYTSAVASRGITENVREANVVEDWDVDGLQVGEAIAPAGTGAPLGFASANSDGKRGDRVERRTGGQRINASQLGSARTAPGVVLWQKESGTAARCFVGLLSAALRAPGRRIVSSCRSFHRVLGVALLLVASLAACTRNVRTTTTTPKELHAGGIQAPTWPGCPGRASSATARHRPSLCAARAALKSSKEGSS